MSQLPLTAAKLQRSKDVSGCFVTKEYAEVAQKGSIEPIVAYFHGACKSPDFTTLWVRAGFTRPSFHPNPQLRTGNPGYDKFLAALKDLDHNVGFGVGFHGTSPAAITSILRDGLDPKRRNGQAHGPGEYFSKDPAISVSYCKGGLEMLVFVVVLPSTLTTTASQRAKDIPVDFLVVNNNNHQLPIGTMKFRAVDPKVLNSSNAQRTKFLQLSKDVFDKSRRADEGRIKAQIIQDLINAKMDLAAELYEKHGSFLDDISKREIAWFVQKTVDEELVFFYFPNLPAPLSPEELVEAKIQSVDDAMQELCVAVQKLESGRPGTLNYGFS